MLTKSSIYSLLIHGFSCLHQSVLQSRRLLLVMTIAAGLAAGFASGNAQAALMMHACTSCELDEGGTGVALKNHVRGQLGLGHSVVVVLMDFSTPQKPIKQPIETALADIILSSSTTNFGDGERVTHVLTTSKVNGGVTLYVYRIKQPTGADGPYVDQEQDIVKDMALLPSMQYTIGDILNRVMQLGLQYPQGIYSYQMHVYWNMVLEKELARQLRLSCNWTSNLTECKRIPVVMWAHSDENAYSGKQPTGELKISARTRASVMLKDMIAVSDAVFTVSTPSRDQFLKETDLVGAKLVARKDDSIGQGPFFSLREYDPKKKDVLVPFKAAPYELCDPLLADQQNIDACNRPHEKYVLPVFNGIKAPQPAAMARGLWLADVENDYAEWSNRTEVKQLISKAQIQLQAPLLSGIPGGDRIVLSLGRINASKNPLALVDNWERADVSGKTHLIIAGPPEADSPDSVEYFKKMLMAIETKNLQLGKELIHYVGPIPSGKTATAYKQANVFVSPSKAETQGMTVLEAMAVGTPVAANINVPSYNEFVKDGVNGYLADPAQPEFYAKIADIVSNKGNIAVVFKQRGPVTFGFYSIEGIAQRTQWALDAVWARLNGPTPTFPLVETKKVPDWGVITH